MKETMKINGKDVSVIEHIKTEDGIVPLVDIKLMSDEKWRELTERNNNGKSGR